MARMVAGPLYAALINARRAPGAGIAFVILTGNTTCPVTPACGPSDDTEKRHKPSPDRQRAQPAIPASLQHYSDAAPTQNRSSARLQSSSSAAGSADRWCGPDGSAGVFRRRDALLPRRTDQLRFRPCSRDMSLRFHQPSISSMLWSGSDMSTTCSTAIWYWAPARCLSSALPPWPVRA